MGVAQPNGSRKVGVALPPVVLLMAQPPTPCQRVNPEVMFPEPSGPSSARLAKLLCKACPWRLRAICLAWALETRQGYGVWGGMTAQERRKLLKRQPAE